MSTSDSAWVLFALDSDTAKLSLDFAAGLGEKKSGHGFCAGFIAVIADVRAVFWSVGFCTGFA
jgi:hypothetical protein